MKTEIKNENDVEASFRAGLSQFAHQPSSQSQSSSSTRRLLRRYGPPPIPKTSPPPPPTVAVAAPPQPPSVKMDVDPDDDDGTRTGLGRSRVSARTRKRVGERLNTGGARPSKKMKKNKTGAHGARQLKVVSDHLAEDLDGTHRPRTHARTPEAYVRRYSVLRGARAVLFCGIKYVLFNCLYVRHTPIVLLRTPIMKPGQNVCPQWTPLRKPV